MEPGRGPAADHSGTNFHVGLSVFYGPYLFTCSLLQVSEKRALILLQYQPHCLPPALSKAGAQGSPTLLPSPCTLAPGVHVSPRPAQAFTCHVAGLPLSRTDPCLPEDTALRYSSGGVRARCLGDGNVRKWPRKLSTVKGGSRIMGPRSPGPGGGWLPLPQRT